MVDDDPDTLSFVKEYLEQHEFQVHTAFDSSEAISVIEKKTCSLMIVDLRLESESGLSLAKTITQLNPMPVIMLSAVTDDIEKIVGLETVLDDYIEKPPSLRLLLAKVRSNLRRLDAEVRSADIIKAHSEPGTPEDQNKFDFGKFYLDENSRALVHKEEGVVDLTNTEYRLLELFLKEANVVLSRDEIVERLDIESSNQMMRNIDVLVLRLRRKIEERPSVPMYLQTRRNKGYVFCIS